MLSKYIDEILWIKSSKSIILKVKYREKQKVKTTVQDTKISKILFCFLPSFLINILF